MNPEEPSPLLFNVLTPLNFRVHLSVAYWDIITQIKHPIMANRLADVEATLAQPDQIRRSRSDANVYLFYKQQTNRWLCAVARKLNGDGFLITTYPTDAIKEGDILWLK